MPENRIHGAFAPLTVSQNFLTSSHTIRRLLQKTDISPGDVVYEIGPGKGHITRALLKTGATVRAIELDPRLCARLRETCSETARFSLKQGDFLKTPLPSKGSYKVFSNIPFSRTTEIVRKLTEAPNPPAAAWLIMEYGAAKRFSTQPAAGDGTVSMTARSLQPFFEIRIADKIDRTEFHPAPRVNAALLSIRRKETPDLPLSQRASYRKFLEIARTRGLQNVLTKRQISTALKLAGLPPVSADSNLLYVQWLCLFRCWQTFGG